MINGLKSNSWRGRIVLSLSLLRHNIPLLNKNWIHFHKQNSFDWQNQILTKQSIALIVARVNTVSHPPLAQDLAHKCSLFPCQLSLLQSTHNNSHTSHSVRASGCRHFVNSCNPAPLCSSDPRRLPASLPSRLRMLPVGRPAAGPLASGL